MELTPRAPELILFSVGRLSHSCQQKGERFRCFKQVRSLWPCFGFFFLFQHINLEITGTLNTQITLYFPPEIHQDKTITQRLNIRDKRRILNKNCASSLGATAYAVIAPSLTNPPRSSALAQWKGMLKKKKRKKVVVRNYSIQPNDSSRNNGLLKRCILDLTIQDSAPVGQLKLLIWILKLWYWHLFSVFFLSRHSVTAIIKMLKDTMIHFKLISPLQMRHSLPCSHSKVKLLCITTLQARTVHKYAN